MLVYAGMPSDCRSEEGGFFGPPPKPKRIGVTFVNVAASDREFFLSSGSKVAPFSGLDASGFRLLYTLGSKFRERDPLILGRFYRFTGGRVFAGYEWHWGSLAVSAYAGPSLSFHTPFERAVTRFDARLGAAGLLEFWQSWNSHAIVPDGFTSGTLLLDAAESSAFLRLRQGFATGWRDTALGPEISFSTGSRRSAGGVIGRDSWRRTRLGLHANGLNFGNFGLTASAGYEWRLRDRASAYAEITALYHY